MPFKHKSGSRKGQEKKEQEEKAAKLPKLDYFGFLTSPSTSCQPTESATDDPPASSSAAVQLGSASLPSVVCQHSIIITFLTISTVRKVPAESQTRQFIVYTPVASEICKVD